MDIPQVFCMIADGRMADGSFTVLAEVNEWDQWGDGCTVTPVFPPSQAVKVRVDQMRAPKTTDHQRAWPPGTKVEYESPSMAQWIPALVHQFNPSDMTYNLDVRDHAACERVRPRLRAA